MPAAAAVPMSSVQARHERGGAGVPTGLCGSVIASKSCRKSALANGAVSFNSAERSNALARCTGCKSGRSARGVVEPNIMTLPYSPTRVPVVPVHSPIPPYGALVPPNAPSSHELTDSSFCSLVAKRCALVLRAALPFDEFLEQRLLLIEAMTKFCGTAALATTPALAAIGLAVMAERCASQDPASGVRLRPGRGGEIDLAPFRAGQRLAARQSANSVSTKRAMRAAAQDRPCPWLLKAPCRWRRFASHRCLRSDWDSRRVWSRVGR